MATKHQLAAVRRGAKQAAESISTGAVLGAASAPLVLRVADDALPTLVSPMWDKAILGAAQVGIGLAIPKRHKALRYGAFASGAVTLGLALADALLGDEEE